MCFFVVNGRSWCPFCCSAASRPTLDRTSQCKGRFLLAAGGHAKTDTSRCFWMVALLPVFFCKTWTDVSLVIVPTISCSYCLYSWFGYVWFISWRLNLIPTLFVSANAPQWHHGWLCTAPTPLPFQIACIVAVSDRVPGVLLERRHVQGASTPPFQDSKSEAMFDIFWPSESWYIYIYIISLIVVLNDVNIGELWSITRISYGLQAWYFIAANVIMINHCWALGMGCYYTIIIKAVVINHI